MSITTIELQTRYKVFGDHVGDLSREKLEIALDVSLVTEYDEELEILADRAGLEDLLEIMQILKSCDCPLDWAVEHKCRHLIELHGGTEIPYLAIEAKLFDWATELLDGATDWEQMLCSSADASWEWGCEKAIEMGADDWDGMLTYSAGASFQWGCEKAMEMGATDWDGMLTESALGSFRWGCEKAMEMGATDWDGMLVQSAFASWQWGCEYAIEMGAADWDLMLSRSRFASWQWGIEKAKKMGGKSGPIYID